MMIRSVEEDGKVLLQFLVTLCIFADFHFKLLDLVPNPELLGGVISYRY
jgi:hypothetical protein